MMVSWGRFMFLSLMKKGGKRILKGNVNMKEMIGEN